MLSRIGTITGSALALYCCKAHAKINRKIENSTPCKIVTHENFNLKLGTRDYVADITHYATLGSNRSGWAPPNRGNITRLWLFCYPVLFLDPAHILTFNGSNHHHHIFVFLSKYMMMMMMMMMKWRPFSGRDDGWGNMPQPPNPSKRGGSRQFYGKTLNSLHRNNSGTINPTNLRFDDRV